jgi:hypothetical protein
MQVVWFRGLGFMVEGQGIGIEMQVVRFRGVGFSCGGGGVEVASEVGIEGDREEGKDGVKGQNEPLH